MIVSKKPFIEWFVWKYTSGWTKRRGHDTESLGLIMSTKHATVMSFQYQGSEGEVGMRMPVIESSSLGVVGHPSHHHRKQPQGPRRSWVVTAPVALLSMMTFLAFCPQATRGFTYLAKPVAWRGTSTTRLSSWALHRPRRSMMMMATTSSNADELKDAIGVKGNEIRDLKVCVIGILLLYFGLDGMSYTIIVIIIMNTILIIIIIHFIITFGTHQASGADKSKIQESVEQLLALKVCESISIR